MILLSAKIYVLSFISILTISGCAAHRTYLGSPLPHSQAIPRIPGIYHEIRRGETLWRISKSYGIDIERLIMVNRLPDASRLEEGQLLFIPGAIKAVDVSKALRHLEKIEFIWPVKKGRVISFFGIQKDGIMNKGIDISAKAHSSVFAAKTGKVVFIDERFKGFGKVIIIDHLDGFKTVYAYNAKIICATGQAVEKGQPIAEVGTSGRADKPTLHFEIRKGHVPQNPLYYLP